MSKLRIVGWLFEDELPDEYPFDEMLEHSKVDIVRMYPVFAPAAPVEHWVIKKAPGAKDEYYVESGKPPRHVLDVYGIE